MRELSLDYVLANPDSFLEKLSDDYVQDESLRKPYFYYKAIALTLCSRIEESYEKYDNAASEFVKSGVAPMIRSNKFKTYRRAVRLTRAFKEKQEIAISQGIPFLPIVGMQKSASLFLSVLFSEFYDIPIARFTFGSSVHTVVVEKFLKTMMLGGCTTHGNFTPNRRNLGKLKSAGLKKLVVQLRDPRSAALSMARFKLREDYFSDPSAGELEFTDLGMKAFSYFSFPRKVTRKEYMREVGKVYVQRQANFLKEWWNVHLNEDILIHFADYAELKNTPYRYCTRIMDFFDAPYDDAAFRDYFKKWSNDSAPHYSIAATREYLKYFDEDEAKGLLAMLPPAMRDTFDWS